MTTRAVKAPRRGAETSSSAMRRSIALLGLALAGCIFALALWRWNAASPTPQGDAQRALAIPERPPLGDAAAAGQHVLTMRVEMFDVAEQLVRELPQPDAWCLLGTVHHLHANDDVAVRIWQECLQADPRFADSHFALGNWALARGDFAAAEASFREALRIDPSWHEVPLPLDKALQAQGKFRDSIELLETFAAGNPADAEVLHRLGMAYQQSGDYEKARRSHRQAIDLRPKYTPAHHGLAAALKKLNRDDDAVRHQQQFAELMAADTRTERSSRADLSEQQTVRHRLVRTRLTAARVYLKSRMPESAQRQWRRVAEIDPDDRECREGLCESLTREQRFDEALVFCSQLVKLDPDSTRHLLDLAALQYRSGQLEAADASFRRVIALAPGQAEGYAGLAQVQLSPGRNSEEAVKLAGKAVALSPTAAHHYILATAHWTHGDIPSTRTSLEEAIRLDPSEALYRQAYARLHLSQQP